MAVRAIERLSVRDLSPRVSDALLTVETAAPTRGMIVERVIPRPGVDFATHGFLQPEDTAFVARDEAGQVAGFATVKLRQAFFDGQPATVSYLANVHVHPGYQRRGIGSALLRDCVAYGEEAGATVHWGAVEPGNQASLGNFHKAGFVDARPIRAVGFPVGYLAGQDTAPGLAFRVATPEHLAEAAALLNRFYDGYNFWRPLTGEDLRLALGGGGASRNYTPEDLVAVLDASGAVRAVALIYDQSRIARRIVEEVRVPGFGLLACLRPLFRLSPGYRSLPRIGADYPKLFLHYFAAADRGSAHCLLAGVAREWQRRARDWPDDRRPVLAVCQDDANLLGVRFGLLGAVGFALGKGAYPSHVHVLLKTDLPFDADRHNWLNFWT